MSTKQVIVIRRDLNMSAGKLVAQACHASVAFLTRNLSREGRVYGKSPCDLFHIEIPDAAVHWMNSSFTKVTLKVNSEEELNEIHQSALDADLCSHLVVDKGLTVFNGVATPTCCAIGPDYSEKIDPITGHLKIFTQKLK